MSDYDKFAEINDITCVDWVEYVPRQWPEEYDDIAAEWMMAEWLRNL